MRLEQLESRDCPSITWIGPDGGDWNTAQNWSSGTVPTGSDDVVFDGGSSNGSCNWVGSYTTNELAKSLTIKSNYTGSLNLNNKYYPAIIGDGGLEMDGGSIEQNGGQDLNIFGSFNWTGGNISDTSPFLANINLSGPFSWSGQMDTVGSNINLKNNTNGVISAPNGTLTFANNAGINIEAGSTLILIDGTFATPQGQQATGVITNSGTLEQTAGTKGLFNTALAVVNNGLFQLQNGVMQISGADANGYSFDQRQGGTVTCDLWNATTLTVNNGFYMNTGSLWTEGTQGSTSSINVGSVVIEGGTINLLHNNQTATGILQIGNNMNIQGNATCTVKVDATNANPDGTMRADKITVTGKLTLGGNSRLTAVTINLNGGKVPVGKTWNILSANGGILGDFVNFSLNFNDGSGWSYNHKINGNQYQLTS